MSWSAAPPFQPLAVSPGVGVCAGREAVTSSRKTIPARPAHIIHFPIVLLKAQTQPKRKDPASPPGPFRDPRTAIRDPLVRAPEGCECFAIGAFAQLLESTVADLANAFTGHTEE